MSGRAATFAREGIDPREMTVDGVKKDLRKVEGKGRKIMKRGSQMEAISLRKDRRTSPEIGSDKGGFRKKKFGEGRGGYTFGAALRKKE